MADLTFIELTGDDGPVLLPVERVVLMVTDIEKHTVVYLEHERYVVVKETLEEIGKHLRRLAHDR